MPEGDTLFAIAQLLRPALVGKRVVRAEFARLAGDPSILVGQTVVSVESNGKNLLISFGNQLVLHTHLKMPGAWHLYRPGESWRRAPSAARVVLEVFDAQAVCFDAPVVRVLKGEALRRDRQLTSLGPDLLAESFDVAQAMARLRAIDDWPLGVAVMHQHAVAGIGNVYKSELLFLERLHPFRPVHTVPDQALEHALLRARELMQANVAESAPWRRTTRAPSATEASPLWVYRRRGMPCFVCGTTLRMKRQGETQRSTYFCPTCQQVSPEELTALFA